METCCKLSECSTTEDFSSYTQSRWLPRNFDHANRHLVLCESHNGIIFGINLNFSQPHMGWGGAVFTGVSQGTKREIPNVREEEHGRAKRKVEEEIRGKINVARTRELY